MSKPLLSHLPSPFNLLSQLPPEIIISGTSIFLGRCLRSKSNHLLGAICQEVGYYQIETNTTGCVFILTFSEEGIPEGERVSHQPATAVQSEDATWRRA